MMTKTRQVMVKVSHWYEGNVKFVSSDHAEPEADRGSQRTIYMAASDWRDMGSPGIITVTIEPGDMLNA